MKLSMGMVETEMKTIILPGYSARNKEWGQGVKDYLEASGVGDALVHEWKHWPPAQTSGSENLSVRRRASGSVRHGGSFSPKKELESILKKIGDEKVNVIAKSVGVMVAFRLLQSHASKVNKVILCGIASTKGEDRKKLAKDALAKIFTEDIICIQNENDPYASFEDAESFYRSINDKLKVTKKPGSEHHYPYNEEFEKMLS